MEEQRKDQRNKLEKSGTAWDPVFESLDQQLGSIPVRQVEYQGRIAESTQMLNLAMWEASRARVFGKKESTRS